LQDRSEKSRGNRHRIDVRGRRRPPNWKDYRKHIEESIPGAGREELLAKEFVEEAKAQAGFAVG